MRCIVPGCLCEGPDRPEWPMPESPPTFFDFDVPDDEWDIDAIAWRLSATEYLADEFAEEIGLSRSQFRTMLERGDLPREDRKEKMQGGVYRSIWTARQVAMVIHIRRLAVPRTVNA